MKRLIFTLLVSVSLTACESMQDFSLPSWSSLNPFSSSEETQTAATTGEKVEIPAPTKASGATSTEMAEMEFLTGTAPRFDTASNVEKMPDVAVEKVAADKLPAQEYHKKTKVENGDIVEIADKDLPVSQARVDEVNAAIERELAPKPIPAAKPAQQIVETPVVESPSVEAANETIVAPLPTERVAMVEDTPPVLEAQAPVIEPTPVETAIVATPVVEAPVVAQPEIIEPAVIAAPVAVAPVVIPAPVNDNLDAPVLETMAGCPSVEIMPSARSITYFENENSGQMVARAAIGEIRGGCEYKNGGMEIDLDILMKGRITQLGRFEGNEDMEAFMTFPYFVAVSTPQGLPVDKQILATAMQFRPLVNDLDHAEKITQFIPLANANEGANYKITVGFQLNRRQLEYNRAVNLNRTDNITSSPDVSPRGRVSVNPLAD